MKIYKKLRTENKRLVNIYKINKIIITFRKYKEENDN
jgi:hypothetical protein